MPRAGITRAGLMRGIKQFVIERLPEQLSRFEANVQEAIDSIDNDSLSTFSIVPASGATYFAKVGEHVRVPDARNIVLPGSNQENAGRGFVIVERMVATGVVTVSCAGQKVTGVDIDTLPTAIGAWLYCSSGAGWCRIGRP